MEEITSQGIVYMMLDDGTGWAVTGFHAKQLGKEVVIPSEFRGVKVKSIAQRAFQNFDEENDCSHVKSIVIQAGIICIEKSAFGGCKIESIILPEGLRSIGENAFAGCSELTSLCIPASVTEIARGIIVNCNKLLHIEVKEDNRVYHSDGNCLIETSSRTLIAGCGGSAIPGGGSVVHIGRDAFFSCRSLKFIDIPDGVVDIAESAFYNCKGASSLKLPASIKNIGYKAFGGCALTQLSVDARNTKYHSAGNCIIETSSRTLVVGGITSVIPSDGSVRHIGAYAFYDYSTLQNITIPNGILDIGDCALAGAKLTKIVFPKGISKIGKRCFSCCHALTSVTFQSGLLSIADETFSSCENLFDVTFPEDLMSIGNSVFDECKKITNIRYQGSKKQWDKIKKSCTWDLGSGNYSISCKNGKLKKGEKVKASLFGKLKDVLSSIFHG